jgi:hypothetical protein
MVEEPGRFPPIAQFGKGDRNSCSKTNIEGPAAGQAAAKPQALYPL